MRVTILIDTMEEFDGSLVAIVTARDYTAIFYIIHFTKHLCVYLWY